MKPKVVLDIASLGWSWGRHQDARGVHRVAQKLTTGLIASGQCDLSFVATSSVFGGSQWVAAKERFRHIPFLHSARQISWSRRAYARHQWVAKTLADRRYHQRALRWLAQTVGNRMDTLAAQFTTKNLAAADIYHSPLAPIPAAVNRTKLKCFLTIHDLIPLTHPETVNGKGVPLVRQLLASLTRESFVFCVSNNVRNDLLNHAPLPPENVFVTPLAASPETFYPVTDATERSVILKKYNIPDAPYFLSLSSFDPRKNFIHLIRCFGILAESGELNDCNLVLVGTNPERHTCFNEAIAQFPKLKQRIIIPGFIPDEDLAAVYSGALAFTFPSLSEGFGIPVVEAMQCGLPVLTSNTTSLPEVIGDAGLMLSPADKEGWCQAMLKISRDTTLRAELANRSLARAKKFSWERFIAETLRGYHASMER